MVAFRSGPRPSGESLKKINEATKSKTKIIKGRNLIEKKNQKKPGASKPLNREKIEKAIKENPMGKTAQKEASLKNFPKKEVNVKALIKSLADKSTPMKKTRLEDSIRGKKMVFKKAGGRIGLKAGSKGCKLAMKGKGRAYGKNS